MEAGKKDEKFKDSHAGIFLNSNNILYKGTINPKDIIKPLSLSTFKPLLTNEGNARLDALVHSARVTRIHFSLIYLTRQEKQRAIGTTFPVQVLVLFGVWRCDPFMERLSS